MIRDDEAGRACLQALGADPGQPEDPEALAETLRRVLSDPELAARLGAEARRSVRLGSPENWASELRLLLEETLLNSER